MTAARPTQSLISMPVFYNSRVSRQRVKKVLAFEVKKADSIAEYFEKLMKRRHFTEKGVINLPRRNFEDILKLHVQTEEDYQHLLTAFYDYQGHKNTFPQTSTDALLTKALTLGKPELAFDLIGHHQELLIHPNEQVIKAFFREVSVSGDYDQLKSFFAVTKGRYFLKRPSDLNRTVIEQAHENGDKETVVDAYLDILDYNSELEGVDAGFFGKVLEAISYEEAVDHVLFGHVKEQMDGRGFDCRQYSAVYYLHANGGLTAADLITELANDSKVDKLANSEVFKNEFVSKVVDEENPLQLDDYVLEKVQIALKQCGEKIDSEFYEIKDFLGQNDTKEAESVPEPEAE